MKKTKIIDIIEDNEFHKYQQMLLKAGCTYHHTAKQSGYVRRNIYGYLEQYRGHYGEGFIVHRASETGTTYHNIDYYIRNDALF